MDKIVEKFEQIKNLPSQEIKAEQEQRHSENVVEHTAANAEAIASEILQSAQSNSLPITKPLNSEVILTKVENILSGGLENVFLSMDTAQQQQFKAKGEETAKKISVLLASAKATAAKVVELIMAWLRMIPKVNRHYLEQEAKIKADEIMSMYHNQK